MSTKAILDGSYVSPDASGKEAPTPKVGGARGWLIWSLATIFVVWLFNAQTGWSILSPSAGDDLNLSTSQIGFIGTTYTGPSPSPSSSPVPCWTASEPGACCPSPRHSSPQASSPSRRQIRLPGS